MRTIKNHAIIFVIGLTISTGAFSFSGNTAYEGGALDAYNVAISGNTGTVLNVAVNYGGRQEIVRGMQILARRVQQGLLRPEDIDIETVSGVMYTAGQKDPDFILRPSGEKRLSNFMLWQAAYSELVEMDVLWPDFTRDDLDAAIMEFNRRSRRFGGL